ELIYADGSVHPAEQQFREELEALLHAPAAMLDAREMKAVREPNRIAIEGPADLRPRLEDHPFFAGFEQHYSANPERIREQVKSDLDLIGRVESKVGDERR